eukprot:gnl/TRDRNA2_/TRDRNA2_91646_c0_seq1.p1 gnl/TRDRNA2_/TRDRNA2_91646_c0~~gnl/TRDRNA2_/TRDRNA2_91646_c0_seq1.p1  ORF type:complete len:462 (+),score=66.81 gnl/TRDRNA2_/TRDRNA2_91646_c0_seq1:18-1403(+)
MALAPAVVIDLAADFEPKHIGKALSRLWTIDGRKLVPSLDVDGNSIDCPVTLESIRHPVLLCDGGIYEEAAILRWLQKNDRSPSTNVALAHKRVLRLASLREAIQDMLQRHEALATSTRSALEHAMREANSACAQLPVCVERLEAGIALAVVEVEELREIVADAQALASRMHAEIYHNQVCCATRLQASMRCFLARRHFALLQRRRNGVRLLQAAIRSFQAMKVIDALRCTQLMEFRCRLAMATKIQRWWRYHRRRLAKRAKRRRQRQKRSEMATASSSAVVSVDGYRCETDRDQVSQAAVMEATEHAKADAEAAEIDKRVRRQNGERETQDEALEQEDQQGRETDTRRDDHNNIHLGDLVQWDDEGGGRRQGVVTKLSGGGRLRVHIISENERFANFKFVSADFASLISRCATEEERMDRHRRALLLCAGCRRVDEEANFFRCACRTVRYCSEACHTAHE